MATKSMNSLIEQLRNENGNEMGDALRNLLQNVGLQHQSHLHPSDPRLDL